VVATQALPPYPRASVIRSCAAAWRHGRGKVRRQCILEAPQPLLVQLVHLLQLLQLQIHLLLHIFCLLPRRLQPLQLPPLGGLAEVA